MVRRRQANDPALPVRQMAAAVLSSVAVSSVSAAPVTYVFGGRVDFVAPVISTAITPGDPLSLSYTFDNSTTDRELHPDVGVYSAVTEARISAGTYNAQIFSGSIIIFDNFLFGNFDSYSFVLSPPASEGATLPGFRFQQANALLHSVPEASLWSSDALPATLPFDVFTNRGFSISFFDPVTRQSFSGVNAILTSFERVTHPVPEPGSLALLWAGLLGAALTGRRHFS